MTDIMFNKINFLGGIAAAALTTVFGKYRILFAGFLMFNILDWLTGWYLARVQCRENSVTGARGIVKKVLYWVVILASFFISHSFTLLGDLLGINLDFCIGIGWFVLASYLVNEIRSVLENAVELEVKVPEFLIKGLEVADKAIDNLTGEND